MNSVCIFWNIYTVRILHSEALSLVLQKCSDTHYIDKGLRTPGHQSSMCFLKILHRFIPPLCCYNKLHFSEKAFQQILQHSCGDLFSFRYKFHCSVGLWVEVRALCRTPEIFHSNLGVFMELASCTEHCYNETGSGLLVPVIVMLRIVCKVGKKCYIL